MDEMDRDIQFRSEEWGYRVAMLALCAWGLFNCWQTFTSGARYNPLPCLILCLSVSVQSFSQIAIKQKMVAGDEEYKEPNKLVQTIIASVVVVVVILSIGTYFLLKA